VRIFLTALVSCVLATALVTAQKNSNRTLDIYVIDVEGGNATLFVSPLGEALLIDAGNGGPAAARDVGRIMLAAADAGLTSINNLIITHYHGDHFGGVQQLASRLSIWNYIDHGGNVQPAEAADTFLNTVYPGLYAKSKRVVAKPGDRINLAGLDFQIITSAGQVLKTPLKDAGKPNPFCKAYKPQDPDPTENAQSVGSLITFGKFRTLHLGDLTWNKEFELMCPNNPIGTVDLWMVSHHGQAISNSPVLVHAIHPRVAIMNNGTRKGGQPDAMKVIQSSPGLEDLWQVHFSQLSGQEYTVPGMFIANTVDEEQPAMPIAPMVAPAPGSGAPPAPVHNGKAFWIKVQAKEDGSFTVTNTRNGFSKAYAAPAK
jgi:competence protein ComEC